MGISVLSILSLRSLLNTEKKLVSAQTANLEDADELSRLLQLRVSELRAYMLTREPEHLKALAGGREEFNRHLDALASRNPDPVEQALVSRVRTDDAEYGGLVRKALRNPNRMSWILESLVRPSRLELENALVDVNRHFTEKVEAAGRTYEGLARNSMRTLIVIGLLMLLLLLSLGYLLLRVVREEERTLRQTKEAQENLQATERRAAFLAQTGKIVSENPDPQAALKQVATLSVDWLANICLIELAGGSGLLRPIALAIAGTEREPLFRALHRDLPQGLGSVFSTHHVLQAGTPVLESDVEESRLSSLGVSSLILVPLKARGRALGVLLLCRVEEGASYVESDLQFAQELSHQTALAIDNARLLQEAEEGLRMREELLSTVAHDLRNPLTNIRMNSELLLSQRPNGTLATIEKQAAAIQDSSANMERLIHDLLDLTKIESGRIVLDRRPHDADDLITSCLNMLAPQIHAHGIEIVKEVHAGEAIADADRSRVIQVLSNLIGNAIKFTGKGGRIRIEATATGDGIRFSIVDNGPGIPAEQLPHIFDRYWQARRTRGATSGLGLSIARGIVEAHGGRIWVESALHIGTRFFFTLPEARKQVKRPAA